MERIEEVLEFTANSPARLDQFLSTSYGEFSRTYIKKLIKEGYVFVNGEKVTKPSKRLKEGDRVTFFVPKPEPVEIKPENIPIRIIHEDEHLAVIEKPCGLVVHPSPGYTSGTLVNALLYHLKSLSSIGGVERPGIVHRLDRGTAGIMVVAKTDVAHRELTRQFSERRVDKYYKALVMGLVKEDHGLIDAPIGRHPFQRKKFSVFSASPKPAKTEFWILKRFENYRVTLLKVKIYTGRTHQIRVHLSSMGYPVLGDETYGFKRSSVPKELLDLMGNCHMLVAYKLSFCHPISGERLEFEIKDPSPFREVLEFLETS